MVRKMHAEHVLRSLHLQSCAVLTVRLLLWGMGCLHLGKALTQVQQQRHGI
jgi:hypothetical protein